MENINEKKLFEYDKNTKILLNLNQNKLNIEIIKQNENNIIKKFTIKNYEEFIKNYRPYAIGGRPPLYSMSGDLGILPAIEFVYIDKDGKFSTLTELFYIPHNENEDIYLLEDTLEYFSVGRGIPEKLNDNWFYLRTIIESTW